nr:hypothetical protein [Amylibacter sp.]
MQRQKIEASTVVCCGLVIFLLLGILGRILGYEIRKDEQLFVPPAALLQDARLYLDMFYNHVPASAWYFFGVNTLIGGASPLLAARIGVFLAWVILSFSVFLCLHRLSGSRYLAFFAVIALLTNTGFHDQSGMTATNNFLPLPLIFSGMALFCIGILEPDKRFWTLLFAAICLLLAAATKANALFFIPPIAIGAFFLPRELSFAQRLRQVFVPLVIGGLIGALPVLVYLVKDPANFLAHVVGFHTGPHIEYWAARLQDVDAPPFHFRQKILVAFASWFASASFVLLIIATYLGVLRWKNRLDGAGSGGNHTGLILTVLGCLIASGWMSFVPTPSFPQYFMQSILCCPLLIALLFARLDTDQKTQTYPLLTAAMMLLILISLPRLGPGYFNLLRPENTAVAQVHSAGLKLRNIMLARGLDGKLFTFLPLYPMESGLPVYDEFATGEFAYRVWPYLTPELEKHYRASRAPDIAALFAADPPDGLLLGFFDDIEGPMVDYAQQNNYQLVPDFDVSNRYGAAKLYLRPSD